jgi:hypothetical protein
MRAAKAGAGAVAEPGVVLERQRLVLAGSAGSRRRPAGEAEGRGGRSGAQAEQSASIMR